MTTEVLGKCPCCGESVTKFVSHHWIEKDGSKHSKFICAGCNHVLWSPNGNHLLPDWETQVKYVNFHLTRGFTRGDNPYEWRPLMEGSTESLVPRKLICRRCGYDWESIISGNPAQCPHRKSPKWNEARKNESINL
jgi:hypothetical protein